MSILRLPSVADLSQSTPEYGWRSIPEDQQDRPVLLFDLDGTLRGDVVPMVRLARPLVPKFARKVMFREPLQSRKLFRFLWNLASLWTLRTLYREQRHRYKHLFSELHHLAAALLQNASIQDVRSKYRENLSSIPGLWRPGAVEILRRATHQANVLIVTGSEQIQTEECVRLLAAKGVLTHRIFVRGSLYGFDPVEQRFTGTVNHLNVTLDGKRDAVQASAALNGRVLAAVGNSRPDRALFESVVPDGFCLLVCPTAVLEKRKESTFVIMKLLKNGYRLWWDVSEFLDALHGFDDGHACMKRPVLATDRNFTNVLQSEQLERAFQLSLAKYCRNSSLPAEQSFQMSPELSPSTVRASPS